ncbi:MAG: O-antigen ligase family protein [Bryobacterales bacterium]|nr:O-antigen ligase family protein [Bryobacterales bacterium]
MRLPERAASVEFILIATLVAVPLALTPGVLLHYDIAPKVAILMLGAAILTLRASLASAFAVLWRNPAGRFLAAGLALQALSLALSTACSGSPSLSLMGGAWRRFGLLPQLALLLALLILAAELLTNPGSRQRLFAALSIPPFVIGVIALDQYSAAFPPVPSWKAIRPPGTLGHAVYMANYLVPLLFTSFAVARTGRTRFVRIAGAVGCWSSVAGILLSGTRAAMLGAAAGGLTLAVLEGRRVFSRRGRRWVLSGLVLTALVASWAATPSGAGVRNRIQEWVRDAGGGQRLWLWRDCFRMFEERPLLGFGPDTFAREYPRFQSVDIATAYPGVYRESPHNLLLDVLLSQGLLGLVPLAALACAWVCAFRRWGEPERLWRAGLVSALTAGLVANQFASFSAPTALCFCVVAVALVCSEDGQPRPAPPPVSKARIAVSLLLALIAIQYLFAERGLRKVEASLEAGRLEQAITEFAAARQWQPWGINSDLWYSRALLTSGLRVGRLNDVFDEALAAAERAAGWGGEPLESAYHLAVIHTSNQNLPLAERSLVRARQLSPNSYKPYWLLGEIYRATGRLEEALEASTKAAALSGGKVPEVDQSHALIRKQLAAPTAP